MIDDFAKEYLHSDLREIRETMLWKLDGSTGTAAQYANTPRDAAFWAAQRARIEQAAKAAVAKPDHGGSINAHD
ncbi:hypothetical protein E1211_10525 [Micromonospora sp. 15K316]|uniref:hypothetical protein n=1 Tax=Micromonospora sp. 15K316 TaxID=2530376 RepID=UPI00104F10C4|nr:hypothetical protein [Micromonospora sp. 15K316]TDC37406.1 hypothetical protein E1211_10525 [Micromonospora sp. 15K316]